MAISRERLELLQELQIESLIVRLQEDSNDKLPTDAATLGVIAKILKDNNITVDPADNSKLKELRDTLKKQQTARVLNMVRQDQQEATG
jgi:hypothetical protein